jgi:hypothetical protein
VADNTGHQAWKFLRRVAALFHGRLPVWAILILVVFGVGGVFYAAHDFLEKQQSKPSHVPQSVTALPVLVEASFLPSFATSMPVAVVVQITDTGPATLLNVKMVFDFENARLQSCEVRASGVSSPESANPERAIYVLNVPRLLPNEKVQLYCLAENPQKVSVLMNTADAEGRSSGFESRVFTRASSDAGESGFHDFIEILVGIILVFLAGCIIFILVGLSGRLAARLKLFP